MASYQQRVVAYYNKKDPTTYFSHRILSLQKVFKNMVEVGVRKLQVSWEGPYVGTKAGGSRVYHLQTLDDVPLLHHWNVSNLKQYYQ